MGYLKIKIKTILYTKADSILILRPRLEYADFFQHNVIIDFYPKKIHQKIGEKRGRTRWRIFKSNALYD